MCAGAFDGAFDGCADVLLEVFVLRRHLRLGVELGAVEVFGKIVGGVPLVIAGAELVGAELEINIEYFGGRGVVGEGFEAGSAGDLVAKLYGEDGFAEVGVGKKDAYFFLLPEVAEEHLGFGVMALQFEPAVGIVDGEEVVGGFGWCGGFEFCGVAAALGFGDGLIADDVEEG